MEFQRYAIYYTAPAGPLADFGAAWLGWDVATGLPVQHPIIHGLDDDISALTETPRKYGFHGTIKPPFRLANGKTLDALQSETKALCEDLWPLSFDGLELSKLGRFLALTVRGDTSSLSALASNVVMALDAFRAPPSEAELAKRRRANLSERQEANLMQWGYPYVLEEFRFHLTLTGRLKDNHAAELRDILQPALTHILPAPFTINDLTLAGEDEMGRFHEISRFPLLGTA
ncbi:MAG: DUF1045 domain-containing protein [Cognatishimia sp.]|uniref:DUF1045 domain-containing protein n=1 Tax=Cognatishimia sp. TaxID=2211648 RepID=UPI003B8E6B54